jgi:uncharacterized membrane protein YccC
LAAVKRSSNNLSSNLRQALVKRLPEKAKTIEGYSRRKQELRDNDLMPNLNEIELASDRRKWTPWPILEHSARTAVAAVASLLVARLFRLPEAYWAPITTLVITQSSLGTALSVSWQRFVGTALGAVVGAVVAIHFGPHALVFASCVFILGLLCAAVHSDRSAYRFGGVTLAIVLLVPRTQLPWQVAFNRFAEVSIGIGVALIFAFVWPERDSAPSGKS